MIEKNPGAGLPGRGMVGCAIAVIVVVWALNFIAAKVGLRHLPAATLASFRVVLAGLVMLPVYILASRNAPLRIFPPAGQQGFSSGDLWTFLYLGFFGVVVNQLCFTIGLRYTSVSHAAVIVGMAPIYTLLLAILFRLEKATWRKVSGMAIAFIGVAVLASENGISPRAPSLLGDAIAMTGSLGFATYVVLGKRVAARYDTLTMTACNHFAGAAIVLPLAIRQAFALGENARWRAVPWAGWAAVVYMAVFGSALAYVLYFWLLRYLEATQLSVFTYSLPVLATLLGIVWLGEAGSAMQIVGGLLALLGMYRVESGRRRPAAAETN